MNVGNAIQALRAGWILRNPAAWKNRTAAVNAITALVGVALAVAQGYGYEINLADDVVTAVGVTVWGLFNAWSTLATSDKVGLHRKPDSDRLDGESDRTWG